MKNSTPFLVSIILSCTVKAQMRDTAIVAVTYRFLHVEDTTEANAVHEENMILYIGRTSSFYKSIDKTRAESDMRAGFIDGSVSRGVTPDLNGRRFVAATSFYKNLENKKLENVEAVSGKDYIYEESLPEINWSISQEQKQLQGMTCQKATARFRRRVYEAWFCNQLPYANGPWKSGGLPGFIVEAYDTKQEVVFRLSGIQDIISQHMPIELATDAIRTTSKEVVKLKEAVEKNTGAGGTVTPPGRISAGVDERKQVITKKRKVNNPIEKRFEQW